MVRIRTWWNNWIARGLVIAVCVVGISVPPSGVARAADGDPDPTFGTSGTATAQIGSDSEIESLALQPDGKLVAAGRSGDGTNYHVALARFDENGNLDPSFGSGGEVLSTEVGATAGARAVASQPDGKLVVAGFTRDGSSRILLARFDENGAVDPTFGTGGKAVSSIAENAMAMVLQPDGKLVTAGSPFAPVRFNSDGTIDSSFEGGLAAVANATAWAIAIQPDDKIVVAGSSGHFTLARFNSDGSLDDSFGITGVVVTEGLSGIAHAVAIQSDGHIVAAGSHFDGVESYIAVARYRPNGTLDPTFGIDGVVTTSVPGRDYATGREIVIQPDDSKLIVGAYTDPDKGVFVRYQPDGTIDSTFGDGGFVVSNSLVQLNTMILQPDGKLVAGGVGFTLSEQSSRNSGASVGGARLGSGDVRSFGLARYLTKPNGTLSPGGGVPSADCAAEWSLQPVPPAGRGGFPANKLSCVDDDPFCDFGASAGDNACTFHVAICLNVLEQRFACTPSDIQQVRLLNPKQEAPRSVTDELNRDAIESALSTIGGGVRGYCVNAGPNYGQLCSAPGDCDSEAGAGDGTCGGRFIAFDPPLSATDFCTPFADIVVPLKTAKSRAAKSLRIRATSSAAPGSKPVRDLDKLKLICEPRE